jgi:hypothetical protein
MAEGGQLPWKRQQIDTSRGPAADYSSIRKSLPKPPRGHEWQRDGSDWKLVKATLQGELPGMDGTSTISDDQPDKQLPVRVAPVDYVMHTVLPSDTFSGICLRYKVTATQLRRSNHFSGSTLLLAPPRLIIPIREEGHKAQDIRIQDVNSPEFKLQTFLAECPHLRTSERRAYLDLNEWDLRAAIANANDDDLWEKRKEEQKEQAEVARLALAVPVPKIADNDLSTPLLNTSALELARKRLS